MLAKKYVIVHSQVFSNISYNPSVKKIIILPERAHMALINERATG